MKILKLSDLIPLSDYNQHQKAASAQGLFFISMEIVLSVITICCSGSTSELLQYEPEFLV